MTSSAVMIYPGVGADSDDPIAPVGPGVALMGGGTDVDQAFIWMHDTVAGSPTTRAGDLIVLRASGDDGYDGYAYGIAPFHSVRTIVVGDAATAADLACAADLLSRAEAVFFAGGNQAKYVAWAGSPLMTAVQHVYDRGGVIGGTSAGCAIMGGFAYDALAAGTSNVTSSDAIADPFETSISFTRGALHFSALDGVITDPHFRARDRMGRLAAFMARQHADGAVTTSPPRVLGIGVDEKTAVLVDKTGIARLVQQSPGIGAAFFVRGAVPDQCEQGKPLLYRKLRVTRLDAPAQTFSLKTWCGSGTVYELGVFGDVPPPYQPSDPYGAGPDGTTCGP
jgi:cyanophycinase